MDRIKCFTLMSFVSLCLFATTSYADDLHPYWLSVVKASDVINEYMGKIPQGTLVVFKQKATKIAATISERGLQARVFALDANQSSPEIIDATDQCNHYISIVVPLTKSPDNQLIFTTVGENWLNPSYSQKSIHEGRYWVVFEKSGSADANFRIRIADSEDYFHSGFLLVVEDDKRASLKRVIEEYNNRAKYIETLIADDINKKAPCYRYVRLAESPEPSEYRQGSLALCESEGNMN